jgi:hypothetical protein
VLKTHAFVSWLTLARVIWSTLRYRWPARFPWEYGQSSSWANNGSMLNAQHSNAMAHFDIGKLK